MRKRRRTNMIYSQIVTLVAILSIAGLEALALHKGIDGQLFSLTLAAIAGIAGFNLRDILTRKPSQPKMR